MNCTLIPFAVLVAACLQQTVSLGPVSIPVATICLAALFAIDLFLLRTKTCPRPGTAHLALACAFALGILGLSRHEAASAAKELAQVAEALAVAWFLFARRSAKQRAALVRPVAVIAAGLLIVGLGHIYAPLTGLSDARRAAILAMALPALVLTLSRCPAALARDRRRCHWAAGGYDRGPWLASARHQRSSGPGGRELRTPQMVGWRPACGDDCWRAVASGPRKPVAGTIAQLCGWLHAPELYRPAERVSGTAALSGRRWARGVQPSG